MNFELSEDQRKLQEFVREFARRELAHLPKEIEVSNTPLSEHYLRRLADIGLLGVNISRDLGGLGLGDVEALLVIEELAKLHPAIAFPVFESSVGPIRAIERYGPDALKQRLVPAVCRGELVVAVAMSESDAGTALTDLRTVGRMTDTSICLSGTKRWSSGGGHAGGYLVYCRLSKAPGAKGIGAVYVDRDCRGISFGAREEMMGFRGIYSSDINFDDVEVPLDHLVVPAGGFGRLMEAFDLERCGNATMCVGIAAAAFEDALNYTQQRKQFGRPLVDFQAVQLKLAEMAMQLEASRLLIHRAVSQATAGFPSILDSSLAKCFANEMVREVSGKALQVMGAYGYSKQFPMEQRLRDGWGWGIAGGAIDIQKINIASALVGRRFSQRG
jgi:butyryl-CoA dehydrogenase